MCGFPSASVVKISPVTQVWSLGWEDSCLENPRGRGAWWAPVRGVTKIRIHWVIHQHHYQNICVTHSPESWTIDLWGCFQYWVNESHVLKLDYKSGWIQLKLRYKYISPRPQIFFLIWEGMWKCNHRSQFDLKWLHAGEERICENSTMTVHNPGEQSLGPQEGCGQSLFSAFMGWSKLAGLRVPSCRALCRCEKTRLAIVAGRGTISRARKWALV